MNIPQGHYLVMVFEAKEDQSPAEVDDVIGRVRGRTDLPDGGAG